MLDQASVFWSESFLANGGQHAVVDIASIVSDPDDPDLRDKSQCCIIAVNEDSISLPTHI